MMMEANQQQPKGFKGMLDNVLERVRSGEFRARLQYFLFRQTEQARHSDSLISKYKRSLQQHWPKWAGISMGITGLMMLFNPDNFWFWQLPIAVLMVFIAPIILELPATLKSLFGNTEQQHLVGQIVTLSKPIVDGRGEIVLDGRDWQVSGPDCEMGREVKIVTLDAKTLYVMPVASSVRALK